MNERLEAVTSSTTPPSAATVSSLRSSEVPCAYDLLQAFSVRRSLPPWRTMGAEKAAIAGDACAKARDAVSAAKRAPKA